jgi:hypothetical protein
MPIPADFYPSQIRPSRIPDPTTETKEEWGKNSFSSLFCSHKDHKMEGKENFFANSLKIIKLFTQKLSLSSQKYEFRIQDPRSEKTYYSGSQIKGVKKAPKPGSGTLM